MGNCPGTMIGPSYRAPSYTPSSTIPPEIRELSLAHEPVDIFRLLGFDRPDKVTSAEFKARVQERLASISAKKGGAVTDEEVADLKELLDSLQEGTEVSIDSLKKIGITDANSFYEIRKELMTQEPDEPKYKTFRYPKPQQQQQQQQGQQKQPQVSEQKKLCGTDSLRTWFTSLSDPTAITSEDITRSGVTRAVLQICIPFYENEYKIKFGFAKDIDITKNKLSVCYKLLKEAESLIDYRGDTRFTIFRKYNKTRKNLLPKTPVSGDSFIQTCMEVERTALTGYGFPVRMLQFVILREAVNPFMFIGLSERPTPENINNRIKQLRNILDAKEKKEKTYIKELKTTCRQGLDELSEIVKAELLPNLQRYIANRSKEMVLFPEKPMSDSEFDSFCLTVPPPPRPVPTPVSAPIPTPTPTPVPAPIPTPKVPTQPSSAPVPDNKCLFVVKEWLDNVADPTNIQYEEYKQISKEITFSLLMKCLRFFSTPDRQITIDRSSFPPPPNEKCVSIVAPWVTKMTKLRKDGKVTANDINEMTKKGVTKEELQECVDHMRELFPSINIVLPGETPKSKNPFSEDSEPVENTFYNEDETIPNPFVDESVDQTTPFTDDSETMPNPFVNEQPPPPSEVDEGECLPIVTEWVTKKVKNMKKITQKEADALMAKGVTGQQIKTCVQYLRDANNLEINLPDIPEPSIPPSAEEFPRPTTRVRSRPTPIQGERYPEPTLNTVPTLGVQAIRRTPPIQTSPFSGTPKQSNKTPIFTSSSVPPSSEIPVPNSNDIDQRYFQKQEGLGCGRHALNNLFGKTLFVKGNRTDTSLGGPPYSLFAICKDQEQRIRQISPGSVEQCRVDENYDAEVLERALEVIGYSGEHQGLYESGDVEIRREPTLDESVIGVLVNKGPAGEGTLKHWVALRRIDTTDQFTIIDSLKQGPGPTTTLDDFLFSVPREQNPIRAYILVKPGQLTPEQEAEIRRDTPSTEEQDAMLNELQTQIDIFNELKSGKYNGKQILTILKSSKPEDKSDAESLLKKLKFDKKNWSLSGVPIKDMAKSIPKDESLSSVEKKNILVILSQLLSQSPKGGRRRTFRKRGARKTRRRV